jgi:choloylglycine hydrolase
VLGNFKTVAEVREALSKIFVSTQKLPGMGDMVFPVHAAIHDATGKGIVVEFINGKMNIHDNAIGVFTNSPSYDWHLTNLRNYVNLTPLTPQPIIAKGITFAATGQGAGMVGLPGDTSPPSRFVKTAIMLQTVFPAADGTSAINLAEHIINNVDIPLGFVREAKTGDATNEYTQWVVFKDLTHRVFYYRTYNNMRLRAVSLAKVDFSEHAPLLKMPIDTPPQVQNVTDQFVRKP